MSTPEDRTWQQWREAESTPASSTAPPEQPTGPLFDALDAPLPSELEREERLQRRSQGEPPPRRTPPETTSRVQRARSRLTSASAATPERTEVVPRSDWSAGDPRRSRPIPGRGRPGARRVKRVLRHIDPLSVLKISLFFYSMFLVVWLILAAIAFWIVQGMGLVDALANVTDLFSDNKVELTLGLVEKWAFISGIVLVIGGSILNLVLAFLYNVASDIFGGIQMTFSEKDL